MLKLIIFPIIVAITLLGDSVDPAESLGASNGQFQYARTEVLSAKPTLFWLFGTPLERHIETRNHAENGHFINMTGAIERFPNLLSCIEYADGQAMVDITRLRTRAFHRRQDIEICAWHAASFLETQDRLTAWLAAVGFEVTSDRVSDFRFRTRFEDTRWVEARWSRSAEWTSIPMSRSFRWKHFGFYGFGLQFVRASDGRLLQVQLQISYL